jgi:polar amino acid transport system permease protein
MLSSDFFAVLREPYLDWLLQGLVLTFALFAYSWVIAFFLGVVLLLLRMSPIHPVAWIPAAYIELAQNVPLLVQVMFWYFAVPLILPPYLQQAVNRGNSEFILAGLALGCCLAAYFSESLRSGVRAINVTQFEASRALGFNFLQTMRYIIFPQAIRATIPPLLNNTLLLFKNTSIAMIIGVHEFMYQVVDIDTETFRTFDIYLVATVVYLSISIIIMILGDRVERWTKRGRRNPVA